MPIKVIYLDDEPELCSIFSELFSSDEIIIKTFINPKEAIDEAKNNPPDLIFLDYRLPGTTGDHVAMEMLNTIPKFLVTGEITVTTEYLFNGIFKKPIAMQEVQAALNAEISRKQSAL